MNRNNSKGLVWRLQNFVRRASIRRSAHQAASFFFGSPYNKPVFILGVPRSGTTTLFHLLRGSEHFSSLSTEGHDLWRTFHHPRWGGWNSDVVTAADAVVFERRYAESFFRARSSAYTDAKRFVEKTPENALRVSYLLKLFPDAHFVVVHRNPGDVLNSIINGWRHPEGKFRSYFVPDELSIPHYGSRHQWCFALIPEWRDLVASPIPEIALQQWTCMTDYLIQARKDVAPSRWTQIHFEDLISAPETVMQAVADRIDLPVSEDWRRTWKMIISEPRNSLSPPGIDKWRADNPGEILPLLPRMKTLAAACGYRIEGQGDQLTIRNA